MKFNLKKESVNMELALGKESIIKNIFRFNLDIDKYPKHEIWKQLSKFRRWYATNIDGDWYIAPSKYIGYEGMNCYNYINHQDELDGRETERLLSRYTKEIDTSSNLYKELEDQLNKMLYVYDKHPNKNMSIQLIEPDNIRPSDDLVKAILNLIDNLPTEVRRQVVDQIAK